MFTSINRNIVLFYLGVIRIHLANSGPDMLLLLLKNYLSKILNYCVIKK